MHYRSSWVVISLLAALVGVAKLAHPILKFEVAAVAASKTTATALSVTIITYFICPGTFDARGPQTRRSQLAVWGTPRWLQAACRLASESPQ